MTSPRYLLPAPPDPALPQHSGTWRLLSANNRPLGVGPRPYVAPHDAADAIRALRAALPTVQARISVDPRTGRWVWTLTEADRPLAVSARGYDRQREAAANLRLFLAAAMTAAEPALDDEVAAQRSSSR